MNQFSMPTAAKRNKWRLLLPAASLACSALGLAAVATTGGCGSSNGGAPAGTSGGVTAQESQLSNDPTFWSGEPWVAADPLNPQTVLATWTTVVDLSKLSNLFKATKNYCGVSRSTDGGQTWTEITQQAWGTQLGPVGDSSIGVGPDGTFYLLCDFTVRTGLISMIHSADGGITWTQPVEVLGSNQTPVFFWDRPDVAVDSLSGDVYVSASDDSTAGRGVTASTDQGNTWSTPQPLDPDGQSNWGDMIAAAGGTLAAGYIVDPNSAGYKAANPPAVTCATPCVVFETSADHGATWSRHVVTTNGVAAGKSAGGPRIGVAADPSHLGRFAVLVPVSSANTLEIWVTEDGGLSWTQTKMLTAPTGETQAKWKIAYSPTGALGVVWRTLHSDDTYDVSAIVSTDGGLTFGKLAPLTVTPSPPSGIGDDCACNVYLDTNTFWTGWGDSRTGHREVWVGKLTYTSSAP